MFTELQHCWGVVAINGHVWSSRQGNDCAPATAPRHTKDELNLRSSQKSAIGNSICPVTAVLDIFLLFHLCFQPDKDDQILSIQFSWKGSVKPIGSTFICVSPRFEFCPLHFPAVWRKSHTWNSEDVWATGGCLAPHWNSIPSTAQHHWRLVEWAGNFSF